MGSFFGRYRTVFAEGISILCSHSLICKFYTFARYKQYLHTMKLTLRLLFAAVIVIIFLLPADNIHAQSLLDRKLVDSLIKEMPGAKHDTDKIMLYHKLSKVLMRFNTDSAMSCTEEYLALSKKINWVKGIGLACLNKARIYLTISDYEKTLIYSDSAYKIFKDMNWKTAMADALLQTAGAYQQLGYYTKSIEKNYEALPIYEEAGLNVFVAFTYSNLGINYYRLDDYKKAIENYMHAYEIDKKTTDTFNIASDLDNMASVYEEQGDYAKANKNNLEAIKMFEAINDIPALGRIYFNRGNIMQNEGDFSAAMDFYAKAIDINKKIDISRGLAFDNGGIGELCLSLVKNEPVKKIPPSLKISRAALIEKARFYFSEALRFARATNDLSLIMRYASSLSETEELAGNYKESLTLYKEAMLYKDSIFNDENKKKIEALESERLAAVKDKQIQLLAKDKALQSSEIKHQMVLKNIILAAAAAIILFALFFTWSYNRRKKINFDKQVMETEMKALRAQMNPHFIFNSLHSINKYILDNDKENASAYLSKFAKLMRLILENSREQDVPLEQDLQALELYLQLEALRFENKFRYSIEIDDAVDKNNTLVPPLLLQPFVENSIIHGIQFKDDGEIKIKINAGDDMIHCIVEDNGSGFVQQDNAGEQAGIKGRKSLGMAITRERLDVINRLKKIKTAITFTDVKDDKNKIIGLRVELLLPLQLAF